MDLVRREKKMNPGSFVAGKKERERVGKDAEKMGGEIEIRMHSIPES